MVTKCILKRFVRKISNRKQFYVKSLNTSFSIKSDLLTIIYCFDFIKWIIYYLKDYKVHRLNPKCQSNKLGSDKQAMRVVKLRNFSTFIGERLKCLWGVVVKREKR
jgi:hypothetical protein